MIDHLLRDLQVLQKADFLIGRIWLNVLVRRLGFLAFAALIAVFGLGMANVAGFPYLAIWANVVARRRLSERFFVGCEMERGPAKEWVAGGCCGSTAEHHYILDAAFESDFCSYAKLTGSLGGGDNAHTRRVVDVESSWQSGQALTINVPSLDNLANLTYARSNKSRLS
jgi:hypothetical protein